MTDQIQKLEQQIAEKDLQIQKLKNLINDIVSHSKTTQEYIRSVKNLSDLY
jgi:cell division protein FtsL